MCSGFCGLEMPGVHSNLPCFCGELFWYICHPDFSSTAVLPWVCVFGRCFVLVLELFLQLLFPFACSVCNYSTADCFQNSLSELLTAVTPSMSGAHGAACAPSISCCPLKVLRRTTACMTFVSFLSESTSRGIC